ncbi:TlpA family protein disulfide reductase [Chryseobacterium gallinarum]|uniref:TlpA family protein disulfide reductase n=1 Tax=Chryseobacterium gallinarum TaxID=1324352 RepID=A0ABX6KS71_CHRGL|nr:TlpA disulfide reductase family protein [Chryseobacterium gallinarum]QIY90294.1 TlpA family protein disulfide reductase [Chryseobacterium gallinarum]
MGQLKKWLVSNGSTVVLAILLIVLLVNPDAKAWLMRQVASTGLLNSSMSEPGNKDDKGASGISYADFPLINEQGKNISDWKGKVVFINFWASWCPPCRAEFPSIQKFYEKYRSHPDLVFLTVNLDNNPAAGKAYLKEKGFTVPFLTPAGSVPKEIYDGSLPTTVVLDKQGKIRLRHTGVADYSKDSFYNEIDTLLK